MCDLLREISNDTIKQLNKSFTNNQSIDDLDGITLNHEPFTHFTISNLINNQTFLNDLKKDLLKTKFNRKNNDLYKFNQTNDLSKSKSKSVQKIRDLLYGKFLNFLKEITGIHLLDDKIDMTSSKYEYTDYLLCHDDDIHGNEYGRRIAFVFYLVSPDWNKSDGGCLDLFKVNENLQPTNVVKSLVPVENRILFFEVSDRSFHQVSEVLSESKTRLSLHGWFHGAINYRPPTYIELFQNPKPYLVIDHSLFFDWIEEKYLNPVNQSEIQDEFCESSEIKLSNAFNSQKYEEVKNALKSENINWKMKGPRNRRHYEVADEESLPSIIHEFIKVLTCDSMALTLSNLTGLNLHPNSTKNTIDQISDNDEDDCSTSKPCTSKSVKESNNEPPNKKTKNNDLPKNGQNENKSSSTCYYEVRRWKHGYYTLVTDVDAEIQVNSLDAMLFFHCDENYNEDCGGNVTYIAKDEDDELLTVFPEENCLALVYRDQETLKFTKYVNSRFNSDSSNDSSFYEISLVYYE